MNDFKTMVANIGLELGDTLFVDVAAIDSYTFEKHLSNKKTTEKINSKKWDYVVLQEFSKRSITKIDDFESKTVSFAKALQDIIYRNNPDTKVLLFMTWGYKFGSSSHCQKYKYACDYTSMQDSIASRYYFLGEKLNADVVPCGLAWKLINENQNQQIELYETDAFHPNPTGSFLNAIVFYQAITSNYTDNLKYNPVNLDNTIFYLLIDAATKIADDFYQKYSKIRE